MLADTAIRRSQPAEARMGFCRQRLRFLGDACAHIGHTGFAKRLCYGGVAAAAQRFGFRRARGQEWTGEDGWGAFRT
jgi:hypothetical protein